MKFNVPKTLLTALLMMMFSAVLCPAQRPERVLLGQSPAPPPAKVIQKLDDGGYLVEIGGARFRALTADQLRAWGKAQVELEGAQKDNKELEGQVATLNHEKEVMQRDVKLAEQDRDAALKDLARSREDTERAREDAKRNFGLFIGERGLRVEAQQFIPHGDSKGVLGKVLNFLDSKEFQIGMKLVKPVTDSVRLWTMSPCAQ